MRGLLVFSVCGLSGNKLLMLSLASLRLWRHRASSREGQTVLTGFPDAAFRSAETYSSQIFLFFFEELKMVDGSQSHPFKTLKSL